MIPASLCRICVVQRASGQVSVPVGLLLLPAVSSIPPMLRTHVRPNVTLTTNSTFRKSGSNGGTGFTVKLHEMLPLMFGN